MQDVFAVQQQVVTHDPSRNSVAIELNGFSVRQRRRVRRYLGKSRMFAKVNRVQELIVALCRGRVSLDAIHELVNRAVRAVLNLAATKPVLEAHEQPALATEVSLGLNARQRKPRRHGGVYHNVPPAPRRMSRR